MRITKITEKQKRVLAYIEKTILENSVPPTMREIGENFNITVKGAYDHVRALIKKGYVEQVPDKARCLRIVKDDIADIEKLEKLLECGFLIPGYFWDDDEKQKTKGCLECISNREFLSELVWYKNFKPKKVDILLFGPIIEGE